MGTGCDSKLEWKKLMIRILGVWSTNSGWQLWFFLSVRAEGSDPPRIFDTDAHDDSIDALLQQGNQYDNGGQPSRIIK